ncbi:ABC transporter permease [Bacillus marinisedimentorum]|uniref:ABC transporter permease n=1 Tax=Bacillus marinisedimentorum TaxID=1821260 RepID=UPI000873081E|nr:ABC transporter permease [Bacillus marinisedimentorum]
MRAVLWARLMNFKHNPKTFLLMLILPVAFTAAFGFANTEYRVTVPIVDEDETELSRKLISALSESDVFTFETMEKQTAEDEVTAGNAEAAFIIPNGFQEDIRSGSKASIRVLKVKESQVFYSAQNEVLQEARELADEQYTVSLITAGLAEGTGAAEATVRQAALAAYSYEKRSTPAFAVHTGTVEEEGGFLYDQQLQSSLGFTLFFVMFTVIFSVGELVEDREKGIFSRLVVSPVTRWEIYAGNFFYSFLIGTFQVILLAALWKYVFRFDWGDSWGLIFAVMLPFVFAITALGLLLSAFVKNMKQLSSIVPLIAVSSAMLGGAYWPIEIVTSDILIWISKLIPLSYAVEGMKAVALYHEGLQGVVQPALIMAGMGAAMAGAGIFILEKR